MASFEILAAIDLRGGRVVRLREGDFERETVYGDDPGETARRLADGGADAFHVVDLDGARAGEVRQRAAIVSIFRAAGSVPVEVGGGIRDVPTASGMLRAGARRVVVGTAAIEDPAFARALVKTVGTESVVVSVDLRDGRALGHGWRAGERGRSLEDVLALVAEAGVTTIEVTAIERDGSLDGPDLRLLGRVVRMGAAAVVATV